jgi:hypothetical protein
MWGQKWFKALNLGFLSSEPRSDIGVRANPSSVPSEKLKVCYSFEMLKKWGDAPDAAAPSFCCRVSISFAFVSGPCKLLL